MTHEPLNPADDLPMAPPSGAPVQLPPPPKKPIYRKWWFWVLVVVGLLIVVSAFGSGDDSAGTASDSVSSQPVEPTSLAGSSLKEAIDALRNSGVPKESIQVVGTVTMLSSDASVYDSTRFAIENTGDEDYQRSQTICGVRVDGAGTSEEVIVLWSESSCEEGEQRLAEYQASAAPAVEEEAVAVEDPSSGDAGMNETPAEVGAEDSPEGFAILARGDMADLAKDLEDMAIAAAEGGIFRVLGNSVELSFNVAQLEALTPPETIADDWNSGLARLSAEVDAISEVLADDGSTEGLIGQIDAAANALVELSSVVDALESN